MKISGPDRGATPVIGNVLLVAIVVVVGSLVFILAAGLVQTGAPTAEAVFEYEETNVGLEMTPVAIATDVTVQLNGKPVASFESDGAGESILLPTAPGDTITVISADERRSVLVQKQIEGRSQIGDFIAYYTFDTTSGALRDRSGNGNDGAVNGDPERSGSSFTFDGSNDFVEVQDISSPVDVNEFTIAATYRTDDASKKQEIVEHKSGADNWLFELKPCSNDEVDDDICSGDDRYVPVFNVDQAGGSQDGQIFGSPQRAGTQHTLVGTYDGEKYTLYVDGARMASGNYSGEISMGDMNLGRDIEFDGDYLEGDISELRLYYSAFDQREVEIITNAMS